MITDNDITKLKQIFATKEDLKRFATKEDLKRFATKEDLKRFATKEDLKRFATKEDLERFATKKDFKDVNNRVDTLAIAMMKGFEEARKDRELIRQEMKEQTDRILTAFDKLHVKLDRYFQEHVMLSSKVDRHDTWIHAIADKTDVKLISGS